MTLPTANPMIGPALGSVRSNPSSGLACLISCSLILCVLEVQRLLKPQIAHRHHLVFLKPAPENQSANADGGRKRREIQPMDLRTVLIISRHHDPVEVDKFNHQA